MGLIAAGLATPASAQIVDNLGTLGPENAKGYLGPLPKAFSGTLNSGIFQSGNVPRAGVTFGIGVQVMGVKFEGKDRTYTPVDEPGFVSTETVEAPTVVGSTDAVPQDGQGGTVFYYPGGFDIGEFMMAVPELTIGSVAGTSLVLRWISADVGDADLGDVSVFGIGGQHSISQYLTAAPFDLAAGVFYQTLKIDDELLDCSSLHFDVTGSREFGSLQPYVGVGYDSFDMTVEYAAGSDPDETIKAELDTESNARMTLGALLSFPLVKLSGEINLASSNSVAVGLSFGR
jgi:hypothetical protein